MALTSYITYKILQEMAAPGRGVLKGTVSHLPIQYDKDDILFLNQFDSKKWSDAIHIRYDMLHDALIKLQKVRDDISGLERTEAGTKIIEGGLADNIKKFLMGEPSQLEEEDKETIRKRHTFKSGKTALPLVPGKTDAFWSQKTPKAKVTEQDIEEIAEDDAFEIAKEKTENLEDAIDAPKGKVEFKIGVSKVRAFPYLNRLYHKLERTRGEPHHISSRLDGVGEHGFDLSHPAIKKADGEEDKVKKTTRGLNWVVKSTWDKSLKGIPATANSSFRAGYLAHSAYNHFGDLKSTPAYRNAEENGTLQWFPMNGKEGRAKIVDPKIDWLKEYEFKKLKEEYAKKAHDPTAEKKSIESIREEAEKNINSMIERGEVYAHPVPGIPDSERQYKLIDGEPNIQYIYLPHQKIMMPKEHPDEPDVEKYVPILLKSKTLLKKGIHDFEPVSIEEDPEAVETGERTGIVNVGPTPNRNEPAQAFSDLRVASNYHLKELLDSLLVSDYEYRRGVRIQGVIPDFIIGIKATLYGSSRSGGASPGVQRMLRTDPEKIIELHNMVYNFILEKHLASKKMQTEDGRRRLAQSLISSYLQGTQYEVQRRMRKGARITGFGDVATGAEDSADFDPSATSGIKGMGVKRARGQTIFSKTLQQIRDSLSQMEKRISEKETITPKIERGDSFEASKAKLDQIMKNVQEKSEFFEILKNGLIEEIKMAPKEAEDLIKSWEEAETDPNRPDWTLDRIKEIFMGMLQSAKTGEEMQVTRPEPVGKIKFKTPPKAAPFVRAKMTPQGVSPLLRKKPIQGPPEPNAQPGDTEAQSEWSRLSITERVNYFKNKLKS